jgi:hypothetical protein
MLDDWEQKAIYDKELASTIGCSPSRAAEIRLAHDAQWQTLNPRYVNQAQITPAEILGFNAFHAARTNLYSCVLPGEVIYKCVQAIQQGALQLDALPQIDHLIVDEFQDLNACDQEFVRLLSADNDKEFLRRVADAKSRVALNRFAGRSQGRRRAAWGFNRQMATLYTEYDEKWFGIQGRNGACGLLSPANWGECIGIKRSLLEKSDKSADPRAY